jgi:D-arabinose 1-dehydrogenase-like Zn-dependent alcohol dehydrogenase
MGVGGLGAYAVQYAKLLGAGATVVALARSDEKLALATENGADHTINTRDKSDDQVRDELEKATVRSRRSAWSATGSTFRCSRSSAASSPTSGRSGGTSTT